MGHLTPTVECADCTNLVVVPVGVASARCETCKRVRAKRRRFREAYTRTAKIDNIDATGPSSVSVTKIKLPDGTIITPGEVQMEVMIVPTNLSFKPESPFCAASLKHFPCVCVTCGHTGTAATPISEYPSRYIPQGWGYDGESGAVWCTDCVHYRAHEGLPPRFYMHNKARIDTAQPNASMSHPGDLYTVHFTARAHTPDTTKEDDVNSNHIAINAGTGGDAEQENEAMDRKDRLKQQARQASSALGSGVQLAVANEAGEIFVDIAREMTKDVPAMQMALEHPDGREVAKVLVALMVQTAAAQTNILPKSEYVGRACELQMTASAFTLVSPRLNELRKHFVKLAKIGEQLEGDYTDEEMAEANREVDAELKALKDRITELEARPAVDARVDLRDVEAEEEEEEAAPSVKVQRRRR